MLQVPVELMAMTGETMATVERALAQAGLGKD